MYYAGEIENSGSNSPPPGHRRQSNAQGEGGRVLKLRFDRRNIRFPFFIRGDFHTLDDRYCDHARELHLISAQIRNH